MAASNTGQRRARGNQHLEDLQPAGIAGEGEDVERACVGGTRRRRVASDDRADGGGVAGADGVEQSLNLIHAVLLRPTI